MARRRSTRRSTTRRVARRAYGGVRRYAHRSYRSASRATLNLLDVGFSFAYGYARPYLVNNTWAQSLMAMVPFGGAYKDNLVIGLGAYLANYLFKPTNTWVKLALRTIVHGEAFIAGSKMNAGASMISTGGTTVVYN